METVAIERVVSSFVIFLILVVCMLFGNFIYVWINSYKLSRYLKTNNYERWRDLTTIGKNGPGLNNPVKGFKYIYGNQDNDNEVILRLKDAIRGGLRYVSISLATIILTIIVGAIFIKVYGN